MSMVNREKRKNAGRRMGGLVGKAMEEEEDDAFWSHETWDDDAEDSGNDSFHESDEDSVLKKDVFDSDFDDSESDNEKDEAAAGEAEELELQKSERARRRQKSNTNYIDAAKSSSTIGNRGKKGVANKRAVGEGYNAGILLNFPSNSSDSLAQSNIGTLQSKNQSTSLQSIIDTKNATAATVNNIPVPLPAFNTSQTENAPSSKNSNRGIDPFIRSSRVSLRERRSTQGVRKISENRSTPSRRIVTVTAATTIASTGRKKASSSGSNTRTAAKRKRHSQEELLLEAIHETEPENQRWLFGRKRVQDQHDKDKDLNSGLRDKYRGKKIIQKFHSRRGCLNTLTFPEMDSVPEILTRRQLAQTQTQSHQPQQHSQGINHESRTGTISSSSSELAPKQRSSICVITGKPSKYKDPLTNMPYHDLAAFKELRKRHENGIPILKNSKGNNGGEGSKNNIQASNKNSMVRGISQGSCGTLSGANNEIKPVTDGKNKRKNTNKIAPPAKKSFPSNSKLPFQSPKPPSRSTAISTALQQQSQQENPPQLPTLPTFSLSRKDASTTTISVATIGSSLSVSGKRLSPRKRKPSEKVLETICMSPGNNSPSPSSSTMEKPSIAATRTTTPPDKTHSGNIEKINNNSGHLIKNLKESVINGNSSKEPKTVWDSADNVPHERQSTTDSKPKQAASVMKIVSIQPIKTPPVRETINNDKPVSTSVTPIAGRTFIRTISTKNCNGVTQKITSATATTTPPTATSDYSSFNIDSAKIEANTIQKYDIAVTKSINKIQLQVLSKEAIAKEAEEKEGKKNVAYNEEPIDIHRRT